MSIVIVNVLKCIQTDVICKYHSHYATLCHCIHFLNKYTYTILTVTFQSTCLSDRCCAIHQARRTGGQCYFNCHGVGTGYVHVRVGIKFQCKIVSPKVWNKRLRCETDLTFTIDIFYVIPTSYFTCAVMKHLTFKFDLMSKLVSLPGRNQNRIKQKVEEN